MDSLPGDLHRRNAIAKESRAGHETRSPSFEDEDPSISDTRLFALRLCSLILVLSVHPYATKVTSSKTKGITRGRASQPRDVRVDVAACSKTNTDEPQEAFFLERNLKKYDRMADCFCARACIWYGYLVHR